MKTIKWSDNDKYFGPFTYCNSDCARIAMVLGSGDEEYGGCRLRISALGKTLITALPPVISPSKTWVDTSKYEWSSGKGGYWAVNEREYGFSYQDGYLDIRFGRQTSDSSTEQRKGFFFPWTQWRHVRTSHYDVQGNQFYTEAKSAWRLENPTYEIERVMIESCPSMSFDFQDYDGEELSAKTTIREMEWRFGTGSFKWLSLFRKPKISRELVIKFSGETGERKGSWKGGTTGHSIEMQEGELHESAFKRYCLQHNMKFVSASNEEHSKGVGLILTEMKMINKESPTTS